MEQQTIISDIAKDTLKGLSSNPKFLLSKYFYDDKGSTIFQDIMHMPEYYLTKCEFEIFSTYRKQISHAFYDAVQEFDLIELGSGDGLKTKILLQELIDQSVNFEYIPVDISHKANIELVKSLKEELPFLNVNAKTGDYFSEVKRLNGSSQLRKAILFLGSNIGNFSEDEISRFFNQLSELCHRGDKVLIGFDLKKSPVVIMKAYNDSYGHTRRFNLNYLERLNRELDADFDVTQFEQHTSYNPFSGEVKSFLISQKNQTVAVGALEKSFNFKQWEPVFMELSRKFDLETIEGLANKYGFKVEEHFTDRRNYFVDSLWEKI